MTNPLNSTTGRNLAFLSAIVGGTIIGPRSGGSGFVLVGGALAGLLANLWSTELGQQRADKLAGPEHAGPSDDLAHLLSDAIVRVLSDCSNNSPRFKSWFNALVGAADKHYVDIARHRALQDVRSEKLILLFEQAARTEGHDRLDLLDEPSLHADGSTCTVAWQLVEYLRVMSKQAQNTDAQLIAERAIVSGLFAAVREMLKRNPDGRAYAAIQLHTNGEILARLATLAETNRALLEKNKITLADLAEIQRLLIEQVNKTFNALPDDERMALKVILDETLANAAALNRVVAKLDQIDCKLDRGLPSPFYDISKTAVSGLFGKLRPNPDEFESGLIYEPAVAEEVVEKLKTQRRTLVRGGPSSGKSVLAVQVALGEDFKGRTFYIDFTDPNATHQEISAAAESLLDNNCLLILDNVHVEEDLAAHIAGICKDRDGSILMLARLASSHVTGSGGSPLAEYENPDLTLKVSAAALNSTYEMVMRRRNHVPKQVPPAVLTKWFGWYGNKLWYFVRAVELVAHDLSLPSPRWDKLTKLTAIEAVRITYRLNESDPKRISALYRLAVLQKYEIMVDSAIVDPSAVAREIAENWIGRTTHGKGRRFTRLKFEHAQEAELILEAIGNVDVFEQLALVAAKHPFTAAMIAYRLIQQGDAKHTEAVIRPYVENDLARVAEFVFCSGFVGAKTRVRWLKRLGQSELESIDKAIAKINAEALREHFEDSPLGDTAAFLKFAETNLVLMHSKCLESLSAPGVWDDPSNMAGRILATPLDCTASFLAYVRPHDPALHKTVLGILGHKDYEKQLAERVLATSLDCTASFLAYVKPHDPALHKTVLGILGHKDYEKQLAERVLATSLDKTAHFLAHVRPYDPALHKTVLGILGHKDYEKQLAERVLATSLEKTAHFLEYVKNREFALFKKVLDILRDSENGADFTELILTSDIGHVAPLVQDLDAYAADAAKDVARFVRGVITSDVYRSHWIDRLLVSPAEQICSFLKVLDDNSAKEPMRAKALVAAIQIEAWKQHVSQHVLNQLPSVYGLLTLLNRLGRGDLAKATAIAAITLPDRSRWHNEAVFLPHPSIVLALASGADARVVREFADEVMTPIWLDVQYRKQETGAGVIAAAIFGTYVGQGREIAERFDRPILHERLTEVMANPVIGKEGEPSHAIQLLGCCALVGVRPAGAIQRLTSHNTQELCAPLSGTVFGHIQMQFWLGLRELSPTGAAELPLPVGALARAIDGFSQLEERTEFARTLKESMLQWLTS